MGKALDGWSIEPYACTRPERCEWCFSQLRKIVPASHRVLAPFRRPVPLAGRFGRLTMAIACEWHAHKIKRDGIG